MGRRRFATATAIASAMTLLWACTSTPVDPPSVSSPADNTRAYPSDPAPTATSSGELVWSEEFDNPAGTPLTGEEWRLSDRGDGYGNNELQVYTPRIDNVFQNGQGVLKIIALAEPAIDPQGFEGAYTSGRIETMKRFQYGRIEARLRVPAGSGLWPAFWMYGEPLSDTESWPAVGEIDIMEVINDADTLHTTVHGATDAGLHWKHEVTATADTSWADDWHIYGITWEEDRISFSVDHKEIFVITPDNLEPQEVWPFNRPYSVILNLAVGGDWPGDPSDNAAFPAELAVDYVRVYDSQVSSRQK